jgi:hypothetical protein
MIAAQVEQLIIKLFLREQKSILEETFVVSSSETAIQP